ncbi:PARP-domain-containing protein [Xylariaceae sp. AK1471]|nr:PARP-domain-containing protein [Xylariaceae sp. AK1471]
MDNWWRPDPPGTINPAKLARPAGAGEPDFFAASDTSCTPTADALTAPEPASQSVPSAAPTPTIPRLTAPRLPRISSDWDAEHDIVVRGNLRYQDIRNEFEDCYVVKRRLAAVRARARARARVRHISHRGYFLSQTGDGVKIRVPVDPMAGPDATVLIHEATASIYDAYLIRTDITRNINIFRRHQVVINPLANTYTLFIREGRVGLQGTGRQAMESSDWKLVTTRFRKIFRDMTGLSWNQRYESPSVREGGFMFVELDYRGTVARPKEFPNYSVMDAKVGEEVRDLMEVILYGGSVRKRNGGEDLDAPGSWSEFSAPYEQLSLWTIFSAFKTLERIWKYLESGCVIHWKTILRVSSQYRSYIPTCAHDRAPVLSSYHAIFLELKFLHSLWPRQEIASTLTEIHRRGSLQLNAYKSLAQPLYQGYSSLRHGFRRLTDPSTAEFRELKDYLEYSCHSTHRLNLELQDIYRVFLKANLPNPYRDWVEAKQGHDTCGEKRLLLWHGTPLDSLLGILDLGLQIRRRGANWTGAMFGNGIYLADASSKSAGFSRHHLWDGEAVLLLCEADVGAERIRSQGCMNNGHDVIEKSGGRHRCIEGLGRVGPAGWKKVEWEMGGPPCTREGMVFMPDTAFPYIYTFSGGSLGFNEYVIYNPSHVLIRYLFRVRIKPR